MKLFHSPASPFARKVRICVIELGLSDAVELIEIDLRTEGARLRPLNPLGKVPVLELADGTRIVDSPVICDYLDALVPEPQLIPAAGPLRWQVLTMTALSDGMAEAGMLARRERAAAGETPAFADQAGRVRDALAVCAAALPGLGDGFTLGHAALVSAVGWLEFRLPDLDVLAPHPELRGWVAAAAGRSSVAGTAPG